MIDIEIPYAKVFVAYPDHESPWGKVEEVNHDIVDWLEEPGRDPDWDWGFCNGGGTVFFRFSNVSVALLFKLTWA